LLDIPCGVTGSLFTDADELALGIEDGVFSMDVGFSGIEPVRFDDASGYDDEYLDGTNMFEDESSKWLQYW
jgi:hypothetical protein